MPRSARRHCSSPAGVRVGKKQKAKRKGRGKNIARLNKKENANKVLEQCTAFQDGFGNLAKSCGNSSSELTKQIESKLAESVVSLAFFDGDMVVSECTGIFIESLCADTSNILTSANLVGSLQDGLTDNIKVRLPDGRVVSCLDGKFDFKYDLAVVTIKRARGFQEAHLSSSHRVQFESDSKVLAVGCCFDSGMLRFTNATVIGPATKAIRELILPTDKMNTALNGCPLVDFDGNFVGVNFRRGERTAFVPVNKILELLGYSGITRHIAADTNDKHGSNRHSAADTDYKPGFKSWSLLYEGQGVPVDQGLELFPPCETVFYDGDGEDASALFIPL